MHKIDKSFFPTEEHENAFQRLCNAHIDELREHKKHMQKVAATAHLKDDDPTKYAPFPAPVAHPTVMASVVKSGDDFEVKYETIDRRTLEEKKHELYVAAVEKAAELQEKIYPIKKRSLLALQCQKIINDVAKSVEAAPIEQRNLELQNSLMSKLSKEDKDRLSLQSKIVKVSETIGFHLATLQDAIHDLSEENVDKWKPAPFPEV